MAMSGRRALAALPRDIFDGAVRGDFASELGVGGAVSQMICGFIPVVGTLCAARDLIASLIHRQIIDVFLNTLSLLPVLGGVSKAAEIIRHIEIARGSISVAHHLRHGESWPAPRSASVEPHTEVAPSNTPALASLILALVSPLLVPVLGIGCVTLATAIILGHAGIRIAHRRRGARKWMAVTALIVSYVYLVVAIAAMVLASYALYVVFTPGR